MTLPLGTTTLLIVLGLYTVIHIGVGYAVMPLIQKQAVHLPPALTLASLVLFGALFGLASVALATPSSPPSVTACCGCSIFRPPPASGQGCG